MCCPLAVELEISAPVWYRGCSPRSFYEIFIQSRWLGDAVTQLSAPCNTHTHTQQSDPLFHILFCNVRLCDFIFLEHLQEVSTEWRVSICGKFNKLDMIWRQTKLSWKDFRVCISEGKNTRPTELSPALKLNKIETKSWGRSNKLLYWGSPGALWPPSFWNGRTDVYQLILVLIK